MEKESHLRKWVKLIGDFKNHLTVFIAINSILWIVWLVLDAGNMYSIPLYISVIWSVILVIHYAVAYEIIKHDK